MSFWAIVAVTVLYAGSTVQQCLNGKFSLALFLGGCSIANVGIAMMARAAP